MDVVPVLTVVPKMPVREVPANGNEARARQPAWLHYLQNRTLRLMRAASGVPYSEFEFEPRSK